MKNILSRAESYGFTLVELVVVIGILVVLLGLGTISLSNVQQKASINTTIQTIISDMKEQQIKAMIGDTEGRPSGSAYGVHFDANEYVLFNGSTYASSDPTTNFPISVSPNLQFTASTDIVFSQIGGELGSATSITIRNTTGSEQKTIQLNKYGVVTSVN